VLGLELSPGNDEGSAWPRFIRSLVERGLRGVRLVISDDHAGLVKAVREQLLGSSWQRCRVHCTRNAQDLVPRTARGMIASAIRLVFEQPDEPAARSQLDRVIDTLPRASRRWPSSSPMPSPTCSATSPSRSRIAGRSGAPTPGAAQQGDKAPDRGRRIFPNRASVIRLVGMILAEQDDECRTGGATSGRRRWRSSTPQHPRRWDLPADGKLIRREDDALLHHVLGLDREHEPRRAVLDGVETSIAPTATAPNAVRRSTRPVYGRTCRRRLGAG